MMSLRGKGKAHCREQGQHQSASPVPLTHTATSHPQPSVAAVFTGGEGAWAEGGDAWRPPLPVGHGSGEQSADSSHGEHAWQAHGGGKEERSRQAADGAWRGASSSSSAAKPSLL
jgi:hypothetical protein